MTGSNVKGVSVTWQPAGEVWPCPRVFSFSQWRELDVTSRTVQSTVLTAEKFVKTAQLLESGQSPGPNASSRGYYIPEAGQGVSVTAAAPEALRVMRSVFSLDKKVGGSVSVCHEEQYVEKDRQTTARGETVGAACPLYCCSFRPGSYFWLVSPQLSSWFQIRNYKLITKKKQNHSCFLVQKKHGHWVSQTTTPFLLCVCVCVWKSLWRKSHLNYLSLSENILLKIQPTE